MSDETRRNFVSAVPIDGKVHLHEQLADGESRCICTIEPRNVDDWITTLWAAKQDAEDGGETA
jgi:hypothetical protein